MHVGWEYPLSKTLHITVLWISDFSLRFHYVFKNYIQKKYLGDGTQAYTWNLFMLLYILPTHNLKTILCNSFRVPVFWLSPITWPKMQNFHSWHPFTALKVPYLTVFQILDFEIMDAPPCNQHWNVVVEPPTTTESHNWV